jgi:TctA family transporter
MKKTNVLAAMLAGMAMGGHVGELPGAGRHDAPVFQPHDTKRKWKRKRESIAKASRLRNRPVKH